MVDGPDPLGKRALFIGPGRENVGERPTAGRRAKRRRAESLGAETGKRALFSVGGIDQIGGPDRRLGERRFRGLQIAGLERREGLDRRVAGDRRVVTGPRRTHTPWQELLGPADAVAHQVADGGALPPGGADQAGGPALAGRRDGAGEPLASTSAAPANLLRVRIDCATCGARSTVGMGRFAVLHLPLFVVVPGHGFTHLIRCPACRHHAWTSVSWPAVDPGEEPPTGGGRRPPTDQG